jgi:hypothetical protein
LLSCAESHLRISEVYRSPTQLVALLQQGPEANHAAAGLAFEPLLLDAAWRLIQVLAPAAAGQLLFPRALRRITAMRPVPDTVSVHLVRSAAGAGPAHTFDVRFIDASGNTCLAMQGLSVATRDRLSDIPQTPDRT